MPALYRDTYVSICCRCGHYLNWDFDLGDWAVAARFGGVSCTGSDQGHLATGPAPLIVTATTNNGEAVL
jgi:hypothetical protein